jgi:hypothetical protein
MYVLGHSAFGYLLIRSFSKYLKIELEPKIIFLVLIFANIIDVIHFGIFRFAGHNLIGTFIVTSMGLILLSNFKMIERRHFPILFSASLTHVLTDYWFSKYHLLFPFTDKGFVVFGFNTMEDLIAESFFGVFFIFVLFLTGDLNILRRFISKEKHKVKKLWKFKSIFLSEFYYFYIYSLFTLFILGQLFVFLTLNYNHIFDVSWYHLMFLLVYLSFTIFWISTFFDIKINNKFGRWVS